MKIAVIGGGASGMMAAVIAAENGADVTIYERNERVGKKILATGNGKCNFSNVNMQSSYFYSTNTDKVWTIIKQFDEKEVVTFFKKAGMLSKEKNGGLYPLSGQASTVLDVLRKKLSENNVRVLTEQYVKDIVPDKQTGRITVVTKTAQHIFDRVILTCGGQAAPKTGSDGNGYKLAKKLYHQIVPTVPALVQLKCSETYFKAISGVRTDATLHLMINGKETAYESGELQFTDYGISGIVVFQLSRIAAYALHQKQNVEIYIDCMSEYDDESYASLIKARKENLANAETVEDFFTGMLNKKLMLQFIKLAGLKPADSYKNADKKRIDKVFLLCRQLPVTVSDTNSFENAQVTAGGVPLSEVTDTLQSTKVNNLYFAGEILDADGLCGGYNLQWAWSSGYVAGKAASKTK